MLQLPRWIGSVLSRLLRRGCVDSTEEREVELHLYAVSQTSRLYLHLQSSRNSFVIRLHLLLACLQYSSQLAQHLRSHFREEFRYSVKPPEATLPPHYPISRPTLRLVEQIQALKLHG